MERKRFKISIGGEGVSPETTSASDLVDLIT